MSSKIRNRSEKAKEIIILTRETVTLDPGEEVEFTGYIELNNQS
jgi:hypothetical protein